MPTYYPSSVYEQRGAKMECNECHAIVMQDATDRHNQFHNNLESRTVMSNVTWCDPGEHAFKAGAPGSQSFNGSTVDDDGNTITMKMDACAEHSFQPKADKPKKEIGNTWDRIPDSEH